MLDSAVIRRYAELTHSAFDTLDLEGAVDLARANLRDILRYLDRADDAVPIAFIEPVDLVGGEAAVG